jgi:hypothetical protein
MSSIVFLLSMGLAIYFVIKGHRRDMSDRDDYNKKIDITKNQKKVINQRKWDEKQK